MLIKGALLSDAAWFVLLRTQSINKKRARRVRHAYQGCNVFLMLHGVVLPIVLCEIPMPYIHTQASTLPCSCVCGAGRSLKSVVQSILMSDPQEKLDPMSLLTYMSTGALSVCARVCVCARTCACVLVGGLWGVIASMHVFLQKKSFIVKRSPLVCMQACVD
jgi:hypothetical protein